MKKTLLGALAMAAMSGGALGTDRRFVCASSVCSQQFNLGQIMKARKNNQRAKNQKRMKAMR